MNDDEEKSGNSLPGLGGPKASRHYFAD